MAYHVHEDFRRVRPPLEGELVRLRAVEESDLEPIHDMFNDPDVLYFLEQVTFPQAKAGTRAWWEATRKDPNSYTFMIETLPGELAGACSLDQVRIPSRSAVLGIWLGKPYWDRRFGTDAVRTVCRFGFREMNLRRVELHVHETNPRGKRAYEKVGFREEGRLRAAHFSDGRPVDTIVMGLLADELIDGSGAQGTTR
jgi:RimJ/RimL family protein N-acetyltransferase